MEDSGGTSLRVHLGSLLASGPTLALILHLAVKCGSRTPGLEFRSWVVSCEEGYCISWVPFGVERVACMTAAYFKTSSRALPNEFVLLVALTLCQVGTKSQHVKGPLCCIKVGWFQSRWAL